MGANKSERGLGLMVARQREAGRRHSPFWLDFHGHSVEARCRSCGRRWPLDLLAYKVAGRADVDLREERLVCWRCDSPWPELVIAPPLGEPWRWRV